jgi:drug/metabolite transporter (DMT)-like permease
VSTRLKADLTLLLVAVIWGTAFVAQRVAAAHLSPFFFNGTRFLLGGGLLLPLVRFNLKIEKGKRRWVVGAGLLLVGASFLQQAGVRWTTAGNAGFITGLYVVFVPLMMWVGWRQRSRWTVWVAALMAAVGLSLLSAGGKLQLAPGDGLILLGAVVWAAHVIVVGRAVRHMEALPFAIGQFLVAGVVNLALSLGLEWKALPGGLAAAWWTIVYAGVLSVAVGYTLQVVAQKHAPPTDAALILSLESVVAMLSGFVLLGERVGPIQLLGAGLILAAIVLAQFSPVPEPGPAPVPEQAPA